MYSGCVSGRRLSKVFPFGSLLPLINRQTERTSLKIVKATLKSKTDRNRGWARPARRSISNFASPSLTPCPTRALFYASRRPFVSSRRNTYSKLSPVQSSRRRPLFSLFCDVRVTLHRVRCLNPRIPDPHATNCLSKKTKTAAYLP